MHSAANGGFEPNLTDAALCTDDCELRKAVVHLSTINAKQLLTRALQLLHAISRRKCVSEITFIEFLAV